MMRMLIVITHRTFDALCHVGGDNGRELSGLGHEVRRDNPKRDGELRPAEIPLRISRF